MFDHERLGRVGRVLAGLGLLALLAEYFVGTETGFIGYFELTEGQGFSGTRAEYRRVENAPALPLPIPSVQIVLDRVSVAMSDEGWLDRTTATIRVEGGPEQDLSIGDVVFTHGAKLRVGGGGLSPCFVLMAVRTGQKVGACVALSVWGPVGMEDGFVFPDPPIAFAVRFYPEFALVDGAPTTRSYQIVDPVLWIRAEPIGGWAEPVEGLLRPGDALLLGDFELGLAELRRWGTFRVNWKPPVRLVPVGTVALLVGLLLQAAAAWSSRPRAREGAR